MRALTIRQFYTWAVIHGGKDVDNRTRNIVGSFRGLVAIHAGKNLAEGFHCLARDVFGVGPARPGMDGDTMIMAATRWQREPHIWFGDPYFAPRCGVPATSHGRRDHRLVDCPCFGRPAELIWRKHTWRCVQPACPQGVFTERDDELAAPRALLTTRAIWWAARQIRHENASMAGLARQLGTAWGTVNTAVLSLLTVGQQPGRLGRPDWRQWRQARTVMRRHRRPRCD